MTDVYDLVHHFIYVHTDIQHIHFWRRYHDFSHMHSADFQHTLKHDAAFCSNQIFLFCNAYQIKQVFTRFYSRQEFFHRMPESLT